MQHRLLVSAATVVALAAPLSSCGFDYATDRVYTPGSGANNREGDVDVLSAVVVSAAEGSGTFVASLANNSPDAEESFTAGDVVPLTIDFGNGERISIDVPVVSDDSGYWEGLDAS